MTAGRTALAIASVWIGAMTWSTGTTAMTLQQAQQRAIDASAQLAAADARHEAALADGALDGLSAPVRVELDVENALGSGELSGFDGSEITLRLDYTLERGGKPRLRADRGKALADVVSLQGIELRLVLRRSVAQRYWRLRYAQERLQLREAQLASAVALREAVLRRFDRAIASAAERAAADLEYARAQLERNQDAQSLLGAQRALAALWNGNELPHAEEALEPLPPSPSGAGDGIAARRFAAQRLALESEQRLAEAAALADIDIGFGLRRFEAIDDQALMLSASMPLGSGKRSELTATRIAAEQRALVASAQADEAQRQQRILDLSSGLQHAALTHRSLVDALLPAAARAAAHLREAHAQSQSPLTALLAAEAQVQRLALERLAAAYRYRKLSADLAFESANGEAP
jgi:cobalt-zinc-cadmium efflux system outer membrane protein